MPVDRRAAFASLPAVFCGERRDPSSRALCTSSATYSRRDTSTGEQFLVCDAHARPEDAAIGDGTPIVLVSVSCTLMIAAARSGPAEAVDEAVARLEAVAAAAGFRLRIGASGFQSSRFYPSVGAVGGPRRPSE